MRPSRAWSTSASVTAASVSLALASLPAPAAAAVESDAAAACERAASQSLDAQGGRAADPSFTAAPDVQTSLSNDSQLVLRGAGRWRSAGAVRTFSYICNVDRQTSDVTGLVLRASPPPAPAPKRPRAPVEPDLRELSPEACESSAVVALKRRWPRVSQITFDAGMRSVYQDSDSQAELRGRGRALPAPGSPSTLFGFDCTVDPRDGRVLGTRISS